ncbi:hypothetical protein EVAR_37402_1 [Eumeta japonica]|uniref:Uncharacterized protein n=1 Tax=Eumeta variegata TaxID=151549 RepID=A0A4C1WFL0_EUMVA|nr:hypothetical protein EVAR_37402_1 [Eumeta japonica]
MKLIASSYPKQDPITLKPKPPPASQPNVRFNERCGVRAGRQRRASGAHLLLIPVNLSLLYGAGNALTDSKSVIMIIYNACVKGYVYIMKKCSQEEVGKLWNAAKHRFLKKEEIVLQNGRAPRIGNDCPCRPVRTEKLGCTQTAGCIKKKKVATKMKPHLTILTNIGGVRRHRCSTFMPASEVHRRDVVEVRRVPMDNYSLHRPRPHFSPAFIRYSIPTQEAVNTLVTPL